MIEASELRIGNLVKINNPTYRKNDTGKTFHILKIDSENDSCNGVCIDDMPYAESFGQFLKYIEPIPLTEEWFIKLGFQLFGNDDPLDRYWTTNILKGSIEELSLKYTLSGIKIKYVHQLQNLYFALTGEELTFKSE